MYHSAIDDKWPYHKVVLNASAQKCHILLLFTFMSHSKSEGQFNAVEKNNPNKDGRKLLETII